MKVAFLHVGDDPRLADLMVASAKRLGYELLQLTDEKTPAIEGVEQVRRLAWDGSGIMLYRYQHLALLDEPVLLVDTDILFRTDVSDVWKLNFEVALTKRSERIVDPNGINLTEMMPYNGGVIFCRNPDFWREALAIYQTYPQGLKDWYGDQLAIRHAARFFKLLVLPCSIFNYTPVDADDQPERVRILHYKGERKQWMLDRVPVPADRSV